MKMKLISATLALVIASSMMLAGCGKTNEPVKDSVQESKVQSQDSATKVEEEKPVELKMLVYNSELDEKTYKERAALVKAKYPNITLTIQNVAQNYEQKLQTMLAGGQGPDLFVTGESSNSYASKGSSIALDEYVSKAGVNLDETFGTSYKSYIYKGKLYAIPDRSGAMVLYYNKDMFDKAGVSYPTKDWTWTEFLDAAKKLTITQNGKVTQYGFAEGDWWPWWMCFMYQNGGRLLDDNYEKVVVKSPENIEALTFYQDLIYKNKVAPDAKGYQSFGANNNSPDPLFAQGHAAMELTGFWNVGSLKNVKDLNWDMAPVFKQKQGATFSFGNGFAINSQCKEPDAAFKAITYLTSEEGQAPMVANNQDAPSNVKLLNSDKFIKPAGLENKNFKAFSESANIIVSPPYHVKWNEIDRQTKIVIGKLLDNSKTPTEVVDELDKVLNEIISSK